MKVLWLTESGSGASLYLPTTRIAYVKVNPDSHATIIGLTNGGWVQVDESPFEIAEHIGEVVRLANDE